MKLQRKVISLKNVIEFPLPFKTAKGSVLETESGDNKLNYKKGSQHSTC